MISCTTSCRRVLVAVLNERGSPADVIGLSSNNLVPFSPNVVLSTRIFSTNPVPKKRMFSVPAIYVLGPLQLVMTERLDSLGLDPIAALARLAQHAEAEGDLTLVEKCWRGLLPYAGPKPA